MKRVCQNLTILLCAALMAVAPGMNFEIQRKVLPDMQDGWDFLYQALARTTAAFSADRISLAVVFCVALWLCRRFLFCEKKRLGAAILCAFMAGMMLLNRGIHSGESVRHLYANGFQVIKSGIYFAGMYLIFLLAIRGLERLLEGKDELSAKIPLRKWLDKLTFSRAFALLAAVWLPHVIVKYPGVLMWDTFHQIKQFAGEYARRTNHPPFGTLLYGLTAQIGGVLGNVNIAYFALTLVQVGAFLAVLANSLVVMKRMKVRPWIRFAALLLYAVSPCYVGWATVICKDTMYLILCMQIGVFLLEFAVDGLAFFYQKRKMLWLSVCFVLLWLTRHNGVLIVGAVYFLMAISLLLRKAEKKHWIRLAAFACATVAIGAGNSELLALRLGAEKVYMHDIYSLPFQQTARIVKLRGDEIPQEEAEVIDRVVRYDSIAEQYHTWYADAVKDTYRFEATAADREAYLGVWLKQWARYPVDSLDAVLHMNGVLFDLQFHRPMYISLSDNTLTSYVYPYSYNELTLYNREEIVPLNSLQRLFTQWYFSFDTLPLFGGFASMGFCMNLMLAMLYLAWVNGYRRALFVFIPGVVTAVGCLFSPVVYLRYALPYVCALPLWLAAYDALRKQGEAKIEEQKRVEKC